MINFQQLAMDAIKSNPQIQSNPNAMHMLQVIQSGDAQKGEEIASNILKTYGISKEQGIEQARSFFRL